jgi:hypothetical protein
VTEKVGFVNFSVSDQNAGPGFVGALGGVETGDTAFRHVSRWRGREILGSPDCVWRRGTRSTLITVRIVT